MSDTNQDAFNRVNDGNAGDILRKIQLGDFLRGQVPQVRHGLVPVTGGSYDPGSSAVVVLPDTGKANTILRATSRAGTSTGELTNDGYTQTVPSAAHIAIDPCGNLMFASTTDVTSVDVSYIPERGDVLELVLPVASNEIDFGASITAQFPILLLEAESLAGTLTGKLHVLAPTNSNPATTKAVLNLAKTKVLFASADAVTRARVKILVQTAAGLNSILDAPAAFV